MKPTANRTEPPRPATTLHAPHAPRPPSCAKSHFAGHLARARGLGDPKPEGPRGGASLDRGRLGHERGLGAQEHAGSRVARPRRAPETDDVEARLDGAPFRPLPSCVFAPSVGRAPPVVPTPAPVEVARLASELLRSLHVGGERGRGHVRLVLEGTRSGDPLQISLEETPTGLVATLPSAEDAEGRRLLSAIARELQRRGVELGGSPAG